MENSVEGETSSSSCNSSSTPTWKFHVFLSFTGQDTRKNFTDHLYTALCRRGIIAFRDNEGIERGEVISQQLLKAIEGSLFAIVVLSQNYSASTWCLDELQKILEARKELGQEVFPIFYGVDPSDVRNQKGSFAESLAKHEERFRENKEKVQRWRDALTEVANLSGWDSKVLHETDLIEKIVGAIWTKLCSKLPSYDDNLVGIGSRIAEMNSHLAIGLDDIRFVGIWGMGGIGKTTLARAIFQRISSQFEICCFLANVREASERDDQVHLQRKLLSHLKISGMVIEDTYEGKNIIRNLCCNKKVLLVLDDVNHTSQLKNLAESPQWFGAGSRVIITTRDKHLLKAQRVHKICKIEIMNKDESLQLFCKNAFHKDHPEEGYLELSKSVVQYAGGLPLALEVLGSFLSYRSVLEWKDALDRLKQIPDDNIIQILKISYDGLSEEEKTIFLDIACFFKGYDKFEVTQVLENCGLHPTIGLSVLIEKSLLIEKNDSFGNCKLEMHDLLQELGRSIVYQESPQNACRRSRLWHPKDINEVLKNNIGTEAIQCIKLSEHGSMKKAQWHPEAFSNMCNLRLLIIISRNLYFPHYVHLKCFSSGLKVLKWKRCPLDTLPLEIPLEKLVEIDMRENRMLQLWSGIHHFGELKFIDLGRSNSLIETPDFSGVPNLERLILEGCRSLIKIHRSLGDLKKLVNLNLKFCESLQILPRKLEMNSLRKLILRGCSKVKKVPEFGKNMKNLVQLDLEDTGITELPESIEFLAGLVDLNLKYCSSLVGLPRTFHNLKLLKTLNMFGCSNFSEFPERINENEALENLDANETSMNEVPSFSLWSLHFFKGFNLTSLTELNISYCRIDDGLILDGIGCLSSLLVLNLEGNNFVSLPSGCFSNLLRLHYLFLNFCKSLESLPKLPPWLIRLDAGSCNSLEPLSDEQLWFFFSSLNHQLRCRTKYLGTQLSDIKSEYLPFRDFYATIPGSEVPSWFPNYMQVREDNRGRSSFSIIVDIPQSFRASEWSGIAVCLLINYDSYGPRFPKPYLCWTCKAPEDDSYISKGWAHVFDYSNNIGRICPHLCLMLFHCNDQTCWQHLRGDNNWLQIVFTAMWAGLIKKCGWRVLCREEMEEWCKTNYECNKLYDAEVGISEVWLPNSAVKKTLEIFQVPPNSNRKRKREE